MIISRYISHGMRNLPTTKQLREKYDPNAVMAVVDQTFQTHLDKLRSCLGHPDSPLSHYQRDLQISLLDPNPKKDNALVNELAATLKDPLYLMTLSKKARTKVTQDMRGFHTDLVESQLTRINIFLDDDEIASPNIGSDPMPKHRGLGNVFCILRVVKKDLELELRYCHDQPRAGYLSSLQTSMGNFFNCLREINMTQKDQITLVQQLFDIFHVDWEEGDRSNIKVSLQQPALASFERTKHDLRQIPQTFYSKSFSEDIMKDLEIHSTLMKKRLRRF